MARLRYNGLAATLGGALDAATTTITFADALTHSGGIAVPTIAGSDYIPLALLDEDGALREIVHLTAYTSAATTGTITRAQESTTATTHETTGRAVNGVTVADMTSLGGGAVAYSDTLGGTDFTTTAFNSYVTVSGLSLSVTPSVSSVFVLSGRIGLYSTATNSINVRIAISPAPLGGPTTFRVRNDAGAGSKAQTFALNAVYQLASGTTYTISVSAFQGTAGTLTVYGDSEQTELSGVLLTA